MPRTKRAWESLSLSYPATIAYSVFMFLLILLSACFDTLGGA